MAINKVQFGGNTLIDITDTTATSSDVLAGQVFYKADGTRGVGTLNIVDTIYPVGSIYMSVSSTSPETLFGGTWVQLEDQFLLGAGSTYTNGATGGSATHTLTTDELPAHTHGSETLNGSITIRAIDSVTSNNTNLLQAQSGIFSRASNSDVSGYRAAGTSHRTAQSNQYNQLNVNATHEHNSVGNGDAFSTLPPYLVVYMWKRTA